jgi:hypothetical protein
MRTKKIKKQPPKRKRFIDVTAKEFKSFEKWVRENKLATRGCCMTYGLPKKVETAIFAVLAVY